MKTICCGDEILPVFADSDAVVCVFEVSEQYVPVFDVFLKSFLQQIAPDHSYDLIVFSSDISPQSEELILDQVKHTENLRIRCFDPTTILREHIESNKHKYLTLNYYRLALPWILEKYERVLNLGVDMIILRDLYPLYHTPLSEDMYIAGVRDLDYVGRLKIDIPAAELGLAVPENYVNADVLLYNLKQIRAHYQMNDLLSVWDHYLLRLAEQDVINICFENHILFLDGRWNVFPKGMISDERIKKAEQHFQDQWDSNLKEPYIVHFAGTPKPWENPGVGFGANWWKYAMESCFYPTLLHRMVTHALAQKKPVLNKMIDAILPKGSWLGTKVKDSMIWRKLRRTYHIICRDPDVRAFGKSIKEKDKSGNDRDRQSKELHSKSIF